MVFLIIYFSLILYPLASVCNLDAVTVRCNNDNDIIIPTCPIVSDIQVVYWCTYL